MEYPSINVDFDTLERLSQGDERAFRAVFDTYRKKLYYFVLQIVDNESITEDLVQDVFVRIWSNREKMTSVEKFDSYLFIAARNRALDVIRSSNVDRTMRSEWVKRSDYQTGSAEEEFDFRRSKKLIDEAVAQLPTQQARVFRLSKEHMLKRHEVARELGVSENTVRNHLSEAIKSIKRYLEEHGNTALLLLLWYIL